MTAADSVARADPWCAATPPTRSTDSVEATYNAQPCLVASRLADLAPSRPHVADLYFLGFAGFAHQDVFMREVRSAAELFDRRFDTEGRSMVLINNKATLQTDPLASLHNLRAVLAGVGAAMDRDEDVLSCS